VKLSVISFGPFVKESNLLKIRLTSLPFERFGVRVPIEFSHKTLFRRASVRITWLFAVGSSLHSFAIQMMFSPCIMNEPAG
jgi:hypothetical protein